MRKTLFFLMILLGSNTQNLQSKTQELPDGEPTLPSWEDNDEPRKAKQGNPILPPFGLQWGDSPETVRTWCKERGYIRKKYQNGDKLILEVSGPFRNVHFQTIRFHYEKNSLEEVELEYPHQENESDGLFQLAEIKNLVEKSRGKGKLGPEEIGKDEDKHWRINRYTWDDGENLLWLVNFQIKDGSKEKGFSTISITSLHYIKAKFLSSEQKNAGQNP